MEVCLPAARATEPETTNCTTSETHVYIKSGICLRLRCLLNGFVCTYNGAEGKWRVGDHGRRVGGGQTEQDAQQADYDLNNLRTQRDIMSND